MNSGLRMGLLYDLTPQMSFRSVGVDWHMFPDQQAMDETLPWQNRTPPSSPYGHRGYNVWEDRSQYPNTHRKLTRLGIIEDSQEYSHEVTLMDRYTVNCTGHESWTGPNETSDGYQKVEISSKEMSPRKHHWRWQDGEDGAAILIASRED